MKHLRRIFESEQQGLTLPELLEKGLAGQIKIDTSIDNGDIKKDISPATWSRKQEKY